MSDLLNSASLVLIPSGYKEDTVYSVVPSDGSGDLSFTRASNGTRVNSAGLVEVCPWNLLQQSETFDNASWGILNSASVSANTTTAPNGTTTADTLTFSANPSSTIYQSITSPAGETTLSIYAKTASGTKQFRLRIDAPSGNASGNFTATTEWQRFDFSLTTGSAGVNFYIINDSAGTAGSIYIWGAQLNIGLTAKPYFPTTDRLNVPRLTYQNGGGGCPSLLLEKQSTNLALYSEQFDDAAWTKGNSTITANTAISPDGTQNADAIVDTATNAEHNINQTIGITSNVSSTFSVYLKSGTQQFAMLRHFGAASEQYFCVVVNLDTGTITKTQAGTDTSATSSSITNVGNGWYRVTATCTYASTNAIPILQLVNSATPTIGSFGNNSYTGNGTNSVLVWGFQFEQSSYATSYIPTTSASATRVADACFKTGISSLIGQSEGVLFFDADVTYTAGIQLGNSTSGGDYINSIQVAFGASSTNVNIFNGGTNQFSFAGATLTGRQKIAIAYKANDFALYRNGAQIQLDSSGSIPTMSALTINHQDLGTTGYQYNEILLFKTRLTNAELASLTTI
jgi:hypothetical protein